MAASELLDINIGMVAWRRREKAWREEDVTGEGGEA